MSTHLPEYFAMDIAVTAAFGVLAILLVVLGYKIFDWLTPKISFDDTINKGNVAAAVLIGSFILGLCYVIAHVVSAIVGA
jgi:putative membrane protein